MAGGGSTEFRELLERLVDLEGSAGSAEILREVHGLALALQARVERAEKRIKALEKAAKPKPKAKAKGKR